ncbi:MAG: hypothetical protein Q8Q12_07205 [bacterium]|nr:hypothetical protein [bacterium]
MRKAALAVSVAFVILIGGGNLAPCQDTSESRLFVIKFTDPGPPAVHTVLAKTSEAPDKIWAFIPANVRLSEDGLCHEATLEMPDVGWAMFRVKRHATDEAAPVRILGVATRPAENPIFPVDVAFANSVRNDELYHHPRFSSPFGGGPFRPGIVSVGFHADATEEEIRPLFEAGGVRLSAYFPKVSRIWCEVVSGDVSEHVQALEGSGIVKSAEPVPLSDPPRIVVTFSTPILPQAAEEFFLPMDGLEPQWGSSWQYEIDGTVYVPEGYELAWVLALEHFPMIAYAEPCSIVQIWLP